MQQLGCGTDNSSMVLLRMQQLYMYSTHVWKSGASLCLLCMWQHFDEPCCMWPAVSTAGVKFQHA